MVAVLGPEFTLGSASYQRCKALVTDLAALEDKQDMHKGLAATWAELEQVLFAQQLILFAPKAVPARKHIPLLQLMLSSHRPALRRAAVATLRHLAERDATAVLLEHTERTLLAALDSENDAQITSQLRATLVVLLAAGASTAPGYWLSLLGDVAMAVTAGSANLKVQTGGEEPGGIQADEREDACTPEPSLTPAASAASTTPKVHPNPQPGSKPGMHASVSTTPRLRTRLFVAELLLSLFSAVGCDPRHRVPKPRVEGDVRTPGGSQLEAADLLVNHLQVTMWFY